MKNTHTGPYDDTAQAALSKALSDVKFDSGEYVELEYGNESKVFVPIDPAGEWEVHADFFYSKTRDQWKCTLRRVPHFEEEA